ncbi:hypothetical protein B0H14DRAFT_2596024 [Mycena olivaceomarginata]|nr:hypothetical protein B0H14DRAFT_2596024 [Mycena olivaceomarginata]
MSQFLTQSNPTSQKTLVVLRNPHNHPPHPKTKPCANDRRTLSKAVEATGVVGLTVKRLLNASSTSLIYDGERVAAVAPGFMDHRRVWDFIDEQKKRDYPRGWGGTEPSLLKSERMNEWEVAGMADRFNCLRRSRANVGEELCRHGKRISGILQCGSAMDLK